MLQIWTDEDTTAFGLTHLDALVNLVGGHGEIAFEVDAHLRKADLLSVARPLNSLEKVIAFVLVLTDAFHISELMPVVCEVPRRSSALARLQNKTLGMSLSDCWPAERTLKSCSKSQSCVARRASS